MKQSARQVQSDVQETFSIPIEHISFPRLLMLSIQIERTSRIFQAPALRAGDVVRCLLGGDVLAGDVASLG